MQKSKSGDKFTLINLEICKTRGGGIGHWQGDGANTSQAFAILNILGGGWGGIHLGKCLLTSKKACGPTRFHCLFLSIKCYWNTATTICLHIIYGCFRAKWQNCLVATEAIWPAKSKIVTKLSRISLKSLKWSEYYNQVPPLSNHQWTCRRSGPSSSRWFMYT